MSFGLLSLIDELVFILHLEFKTLCAFKAFSTFFYIFKKR